MHAPNKLDSPYVDCRSMSPGEPQLPRSVRNAIRDVAIHVVAALGRWWRARADRRRRLRAMARLETLSDRTLKDIGVSRSEIYWVASTVAMLPLQACSGEGRPDLLPNPRSAAPHTTRRP